MNWLAHILLSKTDIDYQLGNVLADPLKGRTWEGASASLVEGVSMHLAIDSFTDSHPTVSTSKSRLGDEGHLRGVVIDLLYDHFLTNSWETYCASPLVEFIDDFHTRALQTANDYPDKAKNFVGHLVASGKLTSYGSFRGFEAATRRINLRLSPRVRARETTNIYLSEVENEYEGLRRDFDSFFPELVAFFKQHELGSPVDNRLS
ncbi:MAG: ACP phosphodiesterase [Acidobacteriota bacterium]